MKKDLFCAVLLAVAAAVLSGCGGAGGDGTITLSYANFPPPETFPCVQMERWKEEVERRTGGKVRVRTYPGGTLLEAKAVFDGVVAGTADIGNFAMSYQPGRFPVSEAADQPHFFASAERASRKLAELLRREDPEEFREVKVLTAFTCPPGVIMSTKPVDDPTDLGHMTLRSSGTSLEAVRLLGAAPVAMPQSDVPDALHKGVVRGVVSSAEVLKDMNYALTCKHVVKARLPVTSFAVVMNMERWKSLPPDVQEVLEGLYMEQAEWTGRYVDGHAEEALRWAAEEQGVEISEPAEEQFRVLRERLEPLSAAYVERVAAKGIDGRRLLEFLRKE